MLINLFRPQLVLSTPSRRWWTLVLWLPLSLAGLAAGAEESNVPPVTAAGASQEETNRETLRTYLLLQEQLHETRLAIERNRQAAELAAVQADKALQTRLQGIEQALEAQRASELDAMQRSNRAMLIVAGSFASMAFVAMMLMVLFQWRAMNRLAEISTGLPALRSGADLSPLALPNGERALLAMGPAEGANARLMAAIEQLERRIHELENTARPALKPAPNPTDGVSAGANGGESNGGGAPEAPDLLARGQDLLEAEQAEEALRCFDRFLREQPRHPEALVKRGVALEKLGRLDEAVESYDAAIAANGSLTIAFLHKGGVLNRTQRFSEALECYEQALRTQERRRP